MDATKIDGQEVASPESGPEEWAASRREQLMQHGPADFLNYLKHTKRKRRRLPKRDEHFDPEFDFWLSLDQIALEDKERFFWIPLYEGDDFADVVFRLPGFIIAAHIHPDALYGYLRMLLKLLWPGDEHWDARHELAVWLCRTFRRRTKVPMTWDEGGWISLW